MINHLALIMDGNRRYAKKNFLLPWLGHEEGAKKVEMVLNFCLKQQIKNVSLYTLSLENLNRSAEELSHLFNLIIRLKDKISDFVERNIKVQIIGDFSRIPENLKVIFNELEAATKNNNALNCNFLFCYGGQQELLFAINKLLAAGITNCTESLLKSALLSGAIDSPDVIIRTGGMQRLSNFLLFQSAYSEIRFLDTLWPDVTESDLYKIICEVVAIKKNLGL